MADARHATRTGRRPLTGRWAAAIGVVVAALLLSSCQLIGGAGNTFGNDPTRSGLQPQLWASINGPYSNHSDGDPFSTRCAGLLATATTCDSAGANPLFTADGYIWAVTVAPSQLGIPVTVQIYDPALGSSTTAHDSISAAGGFATSYQLFNASGSDTTINLSAANSIAAKVFPEGSTESKDAWYTLTTFTPTHVGIYPLQVRTSGIAGVVDRGGGFNNFSIRAVSSAPTPPTVAAYDKSSVYFDVSGSTSRSYLTQIDSSHAGQTLVLQLFDPGDAPAGDAYLQVLAPPSGSPSVVPTGGSPVSCTFSGPSTLPATSTPNFSQWCTLTTRIASGSPTNLYQDKWLRIEVPIPADYSCTGDCWWTLASTFSNLSVSSDRVVYMAAVVPTS